MDANNDPDADARRLGDALARIANPDDLAMAASVLEDLADASEALHHRRGHPKVTFFGSARLSADDPGYRQAHDLAALLSDDGYTVITGGGPGIMTAALEGAVDGRALGVGIVLPFEQKGDPAFPMVMLERFLTRKLAMVRHVRAFVAAAGGLGTLDEVLEVLVLLQTGKKRPAPVVLLEPPGSSQWTAFDALVRDHLVPAGMARQSDRSLYTVCTDVDTARAEVLRFYSRYRDVGPDPDGSGRWSLWLDPGPSAEELARWSAQFEDLAPGGFTSTGAVGGEAPRISFAFDQRGWGRLRELVDAVNAGHDSTS